MQLQLLLQGLMILYIYIYIVEYIYFGLKHVGSKSMVQYSKESCEMKSLTTGRALQKIRFVAAVPYNPHLRP